MPTKKRNTERAEGLNEADGRQLAVDCFREIARDWNAADLDRVPDEQISDYMLNREPVIAARYFAALANAPAPVRRGFLCVLTDLIGGNLGEIADEDAPELERYESHG